MPFNLPFNFKEPQIKPLFLIILLGLIGISLLIAGSSVPRSGSGPGSGEMERPTSPGRTIIGGAGRGPEVDGSLQSFQYATSGFSGSELDRKAQLERNVAAALSDIRGAGRVTVSISFAGTRANKYASNLTREKKTTEEKDREGVMRITTDARDSDQLALIRGGPQGQETPILLETREPEIRGVVVVADGAGNPGVKLTMARAVETLLGVPPHKVLVLPRRE
ncbi:MAG: hypothetical protein HPY71_03370 [Firmicutes bacterium]|nr:hypothetical protein [Bacillota bacterium]